MAREYSLADVLERIYDNELAVATTRIKQRANAEDSGGIRGSPLKNSSRFYKFHIRLSFSRQVVRPKTRTDYKSK